MINLGEFGYLGTVEEIAQKYLDDMALYMGVEEDISILCGAYFFYQEALSANPLSAQFTAVVASPSTWVWSANLGGWVGSYGNHNEYYSLQEYLPIAPGSSLTGLTSIPFLVPFDSFLGLFGGLYQFAVERLAINFPQNYGIGDTALLRYKLSLPNGGGGGENQFDYYFDFPSWAPAPDWYHFATLIKATGETYGKEIAVTREAPGLPFNMEVWRKDPDPSEIYDYYPKQFLMDSNLLDELEFPLEPSAELAEIGGGEVTPVYFYPWLTEPPTDQQFTPAQLEALTTDPETGELIFDPDTDLGDIMPDSIRLKQIHAALEAGRYGVHSDPAKAKLNNLGRLIESLAYMVGVNLDEDGKNRPYPDPVYIKPDDAPKQKGLKEGQFAFYQTADVMQCASMYEIRSNTVVENEFKKKVIQPSGAVKVHNLQQLLDQVVDDLDTMLGGAGLATLQVPSGDGKTYSQYEGLAHAVQDLLFMLSVESKRIDELILQSVRLSHYSQQILLAIGLPTKVDQIPVQLGGESLSSPPQVATVVAASHNPDAPTLASLNGIILANLARVVAGTVNWKEVEEED